MYLDDNKKMRLTRPFDKYNIGKWARVWQDFWLVFGGSPRKIGTSPATTCYICRIKKP